MAQTIEELTTRLEKAKEVFKQMKSEMAEKDDEIARLTNTIAEDDIIIEKNREVIANIEQQVKSLIEENKRLNEVNAGNLDYEIKIAELEATYKASLDELNKTLSEDNAILEEKLAKAHEDYSVLYETHIDNTKRLDSITEKYNNLVTEVKNYKNAVENHEQDIINIIKDTTQKISAPANYPGIHDFLSM